ncbi:MAG TPA: hypothetical protein VF498_00075 [Anaerolineales bacterium]
MGQPIELIPLVCLKCSLPIPAEPDEVAWVCTQCGQGMLLDEDKGLIPLEVCFSAAIPQNTVGKPYWFAQGRVSLQRQTYQGNQDADAQKFWSQPHNFFVPAYTSSLENLLAEGMRLLHQPPALNPGSPVRFAPVTLHVEDVQATADFIVIAIEAERQDKLKEVDFNLELSPPVLWILA